MLVYMLCGSIGSGKSTFAGELAPKIKAQIIRTSELLPGKTRLEKQEQGDVMDKLTNGSWIMKATEELSPTILKPVIVDCVRHPMQIARIRERWPNQTVLIGVRTMNLVEHFEKRHYNADQTKELLEALKHPLEQNGSELMSLCDIIFDNTRIKLKDILP